MSMLRMNITPRFATQTSGPLRVSHPRPYGAPPLPRGLSTSEGCAR